MRWKGMHILPVELSGAHFGRRLAVLRKERGLSQQALSNEVGVHVTQIRRYEAGRAQPTLEVIRKIARALKVSADTLVFEEHERRPDEEFRYAFEALHKLDKEDRRVLKVLLDGFFLKVESKRLAH